MKLGFATLILAITSAVATAAPIGYVINFSGEFGLMDLGTGAFTPVGPGTGNTPDAIGGAPGGPFYTVDSISGHLLRITADGAVSDVGDTGTGPNVGPNGISIMGSLTSGALYGLDFSNRLYSLNPGNAVATLLGTVTGLPQQEGQYDGAMVTSFSGDGSLLYYSLVIYFGPNTTGPALYTINPNTLTSSSVPVTGTDSLIGTGWIDGVFYGFSVDGNVFTIDVATGIASQIATYNSGFDPNNPGPPLTAVFGVIATPEPGTLLPVLAGLAMLGALRSRRR